jgi:hypothetical protein
MQIQVARGKEKRGGPATDRREEVLFTTMIAGRHTIAHRYQIKIKVNYNETKITQRWRLTMAELEHVGEFGSHS